MRRWTLGIVGTFIGLSALAFVFQEQLIYQMMAQRFRPAAPITDYSLPAQPDYSNDIAWAALPDGMDANDLLDIPIPLNKQSTPAAVFFVHPTTFLANTAWNAAFDEPEANAMVDNLVLTGQASAFRQCCALYAPRYRQANFWSFMDETNSGQDARNNAYADINAAFQQFLARIGEQPFILAGHSQGAEHLQRLLADQISQSPLRTRLIAAYAVGIAVDPTTFASQAPDIPVCAAPDQDSCYVSWNSMGANATPWIDQVGATCVNPISWEANADAVPFENNPGSLSVSGPHRFEPKVTGAQCTTDRLLVGEFQSDLFDNQPISLGPDNFHLLDYALFYTSISNNAVLRTTAWHKRNLQ